MIQFMVASKPRPKGGEHQELQSSPSHSRRRTKIGRRSRGTVNNVLPMRHGLKDVLLDPLGVQQHALLVAARAELARLAGEEALEGAVHRSGDLKTAGGANFG